MDNYPLLGAFLTVLWFFLMIAWISCLFMVLRDVFRSRDLSGAAKAGWTLLVVLIPWLGVLLYLAIRGGKMQERDVEEAARRDEAMQDYIRAAVEPAPASHQPGGVA